MYQNQDTTTKATTLLLAGLLMFGMAGLSLAAVVPTSQAAKVELGSTCDNPSDTLIPDDCENHANVTVLGIKV